MSHAAVLPVNRLAYVELATMGWHVELVTPDRWEHEVGGSDDASPAGEIELTQLRTVLAGRPQRHAYRVRLAPIIRRARADVIFIEEEPFSVAAAQWGRVAHRCGVPFGVQQAENLERRLPAVVRASRHAVLRRASFVAARSPSAAELARRWGAHEAAFVPHHVPDWPDEPRTASARFTVGYAGRLVPEKGIDDLLGAHALLGGDVDLLVVGSGPMRPSVEAVPTVRLVPSATHSDMAHWYRQMDVLVLPSRTTPTWSEQFGRVLVEALWCGTPVIGSDSGEIAWVIESTGGGVTFPEGDSTALAAAIERFRDQEVRRSFAERGRAHVHERYSPAAAAVALDGLLQRSVRADHTISIGSS